jgi:hypothetical protein
MDFICRMSSILRVKIRDILLANEEKIFSFNKEFDIRVVGILENSELIRAKSCSLWVMLLTGHNSIRKTKRYFYSFFSSIFPSSGITWIPRKWRSQTSSTHFIPPVPSFEVIEVMTFTHFLFLKCPFKLLFLQYTLFIFVKYPLFAYTFSVICILAFVKPE